MAVYEAQDELVEPVILHGAEAGGDDELAALKEIDVADILAELDPGEFAGQTIGAGKQMQGIMVAGLIEDLFDLDRHKDASILADVLSRLYIICAEYTNDGRIFRFTAPCTGQGERIDYSHKKK